MNRFFSLLLLAFPGLYSQMVQAQTPTIDSLKNLTFTGHDTTKVNALVQLSRLYETDKDSSGIFASQALAVATEINYKIGQFNAFIALSRHANRQNKLDTTFLYARQANQVAGEIQDKTYFAKASSWLAFLYWQRGFISLALDEYLTALKVYTQKGSKADIARISMVVGSLYAESWELDGHLSDPDQALRYCKQALAYYEEDENKIKKGIAHMHLAEAYNMAGNHKQGLHHFFEALKIFETEDKYGFYIEPTLGGVGITYLDLNQPQKANPYFHRQLEIASGLANYRKGEAYGNLGRAAQMMGDYSVAISYLKQAIENTPEDNYREFYRYYSILTKTYEEAGDFKESLNSQRTMLVCLDSINKRRNRNRLAELQYKYESKTDKAEIKQLQQEKIATTMIIGLLGLLLSAILYGFWRKSKFALQLHDKNIEVQRLNRMLELKALRIRVDPHFVFNVLNNIQHVIIQQKTEKALDHIAKLSRLMRYVLEKSSSEFVSLQDDVHILESYIQLEQLRLDHQFEYSININVTHGLMVPAMLLQPYIENAIIHGLVPCTHKGHLKIDIQAYDDRLRISIEDNGVGRRDIPVREGHRSMGVGLGEERLRLLSLLETKLYLVHIEDLKKEDGTSAGTKVMLDIPVQQIENVYEKNYSSNTG